MGNRNPALPLQRTLYPPSQPAPSETFRCLEKMHLGCLDHLLPWPVRAEEALLVPETILGLMCCLIDRHTIFLRGRMSLYQTISLPSGMLRVAPTIAGT